MFHIAYYWLRVISEMVFDSDNAPNVVNLMVTYMSTYNVVGIWIVSTFEVFGGEVLGQILNRTRDRGYNYNLALNIVF